MRHSAEPLCDKSEQTSHISPFTPKTSSSTKLSEPALFTPAKRRLLDRFLDTIAPWLCHEYPGKIKIRLNYTPGYAYASLSSWLTGRSTPPPAVYRYWAMRLRADAAARQDLATELDLEADRLDTIPKKPRGFELRRRKRLQAPKP